MTKKYWHESFRDKNKRVVSGQTEDQTVENNIISKRIINFRRIFEYSDKLSKEK